MDPEEQLKQTSETPKVDINKKLDNESPPHKKRSTKKILIIVAAVIVAIIVGAVLLFYLVIALFRFDYDQQKKGLFNDYGGGKFNNTEIISRLNKGYGELGLTIMDSGPSKGQVVSVQINKTEAINMICPTYAFGPCDSSAIEKYRYEGYFYLKGLKFGIPFTLDIQNKPDNRTDTMNMNSPTCGLVYEGDASRAGADDISYWLGLDKWKKFLVLYNSLGQKYLTWYDDSGCKGLSYAINLFANTQTSSSSTDFAGYKFGDLYLTELPSDGKKGGYLFYYDEAKNNWVIVTDDAQSLISWLKPQVDGGVVLKKIDWTKSPIKPYSP